MLIARLCALSILPTSYTGMGNLSMCTVNLRCDAWVVVRFAQTEEFLALRLSRCGSEPGIAFTNHWLRTVTYVSLLLTLSAQLQDLICVSSRFTRDDPQLPNKSVPSKKHTGKQMRFRIYPKSTIRVVQH